MGRKKRAIRKKRVIRKKATKRSRKRLSGAKKFAIARVYLAGITASQLAAEFKVSPLSIYMWGRAVRKAKGQNPFGGEIIGMTPKQQKLMAIARRTK